MLPAGHRLPPVRDLGYRLGITPGTVARAYGILTDEGVLEKVDAGKSGQRFEYRLTPMGKDLITVFTALSIEGKAQVADVMLSGWP